MKFRSLLGQLAAIVSLTTALAPAASAAENRMDPELRTAARKAVDAGIHYLRGTQAENGAWSRSVGITALALRAMLESYQRYGVYDGAFVTRPVEFILSNVKPDGSITEGSQNSSYNTSAAVSALVATRRPEYAEVIHNAQAFLTHHQIDEGEGYAPDHRYYGGIGYGTDERPDLSNLYLAVEALNATGLPKEDPAWAKAMTFLQRCQNRSESNDEKWAANDGGFTYMPGWSPNGGTGSYGGMTHAGLFALMMAKVDKSDPRVKSAFDWIRANYTVDENPGAKDNAGLFYYYVAFAKSLDAYGEDEIKDAKGVTHNWRNDLARKIVSMQATDGSWVNPQNKLWGEGVKDLVTAWAVIALNIATR